MIVPTTRPDLEEFLSALNGFISTQATPSDPSYLHFLEIFFRSVKANKGHLLKMTADGYLSSVVSYGLGDMFDEEFNRLRLAHLSEPTPLDIAFNEKDALAIVDVQKDNDIPLWFSTLLIQKKLASLVAVPLLGEGGSVGLLCAYYDDVCLFDRTTLDHLMIIGRMVGGSAERSLVANQAETSSQKQKVVDQALKILSSKDFSPVQIYMLITKMLKEGVHLDGVISGPVKQGGNQWGMTVAAGIGIENAHISTRLMMPDFLNKKINSETDGLDVTAHSQNEWGALKPLIKTEYSTMLSQPLVWRNQVEGVVIAWRTGRRPFEEAEYQFSVRLAAIATLALHAK